MNRGEIVAMYQVTHPKLVGAIKLLVEIGQTEDEIKKFIDNILEQSNTQHSVTYNNVSVLIEEIIKDQ